MLGVRGAINNNRKKLVEQAFNKFDKDGSGVVDINDLKDVYNAKKHPDVLSGKKSPQDIFLDFLQTIWDILF